MQSNLPDDIEQYKQREGSPWQDYEICKCGDYIKYEDSYCINCDEEENEDD